MPLGATPRHVRLSADDNIAQQLSGTLGGRRAFFGAGTFPEWLIAKTG
jgi:hypothetical protein